MDLKDGINKLEKLIQKFKGEAEQPAEVKFLDAELKDGTKIRIEGESLEVGLKVVVITTEGEVDAPDGTHELSDGTKITTEAGIITAIEPAEQEAPQPEAESKFDAKPVIEALEKRVADLEAKLNNAFKTIEKQSEEIALSKQVQRETFSIVQKIAEAPAEKPIQPSKSSFAQEKDERFSKIISAIKNIKN